MTTQMTASTSDTAASQLLPFVDELQALPTAERPQDACRPGRHTAPVSGRRIERAKFAYTVRSVRQALVESAFADLSLISGADVVPTAGDVVLAKVVKVGHHSRLEGTGSRRQTLFVGDEIVVAYGNRYAPDQFLAEVPGDLGAAQLVAAGGMASAVIDQHSATKAATMIQPVGILADEQGPIGLDRFSELKTQAWREVVRQTAERRGERRPHLTLVVGASMNSGKSTTGACLVNGLTRAGLDVAAGKATGTGAGNDTGLFRDAGATRVIDFTDFGHTSTYRLDMETVLDLVFSVVEELSADDPDAIVLELADGLFQPEAAALIAHPALRTRVDATIFACGEALSAVAGVQLLEANGVEVRAVSGVLTSAPLIVREAAALLPVPVVPTYDLCKPDVALATSRVPVRGAV